MKFTKYYGILTNPDKLDFVDIDLKKDTQLFIDPWLIQDGKSDLCRECITYVQSFFDEVLDSIRSGDEERAMELLDNLHEVSWTHLGYSSQGIRGRAIAEEHAGQIYLALKKSKAARTGTLKDIEDTALLIPGIGKDKISDIITNLCMYVLVRYTNQQAKLHAIPQRVAGQWHIWNLATKKWERGETFELPMYNNKPVLLVPKSIVNIDLAVNMKDYFDKYVLPFEQRRHFNDPTSSLCRVLQDGTRKEPSKKELRKTISMSKSKINEYVDEYPELLVQFKNDLQGKKTVKKRRKPRT